MFISEARETKFYPFPGVWIQRILRNLFWKLHRGWEIVFKVILWGFTFFPLYLLEYLIFLKPKLTRGWNTQVSTLFSQPVWNKDLLQIKKKKIRIFLQPISIILQMISPSISELVWNYYVPFSNRDLFHHCSWQSSVVFWNIFFSHICINKNTFQRGKYFEVKTLFILNSKWIEYPEIFRLWDNISLLNIP